MHKVSKVIRRRGSRHLVKTELALERRQSVFSPGLRSGGSLLERRQGGGTSDQHGSTRGVHRIRSSVLIYGDGEHSRIDQIHVT